MQHPFVASANARVRYNEIIRKADLSRQIKNLEHNAPSLFTRAATFVIGLFAANTAKTIPATTGNTAR